MSKRNCKPETAPCPFDDESFKEVWNTLLDMPKWRKKPISAIQLTCKKLKEFDVGFATQLVEAAIMGNYQGVVFPDSKIKFELYKSKQQVVTEKVVPVKSLRERFLSPLTRNYITLEDWVKAYMTEKPDISKIDLTFINQTCIPNSEKWMKAVMIQWYSKTT